MPLSEYEQRVLDQMERHLASDDPRLANTLSGPPRRRVSRYVIAGVGAVVGLLLLVLGAAQSLPWLGAIGFVLMFAAVAFAFSGPRKSATPAASGPANPAGQGRKKSKGKNGRSLMSRFEERWDRRRGDQGR